ncbi:MAG: hypothetical protein DHS20C21_14750 [Gemmatimonadota bacterium]|nr:MAG: hypothetical protein DHS20C21_14750 [Gemmatimonadota bacterium]
MDNTDNLYRPFREGMAIHYGGTWGGVRLPEMADRFREEMARRFDAALKLVYSGPEGEHFFANLDEVLQVNESNFHDTIVRLIGD